ncbi:hypothetical protein MMC17_008926 [Xylographa soralifera]|nr:hypothetical protein [Xylographa soralifera]
MAEDVIQQGQLIQFRSQLRCDSCRRRDRKCIIQETDERCMLCSDAERECNFTRPVKRPRTGFTWAQLLCEESAGNEESTRKTDTSVSELSKSVFDDLPNAGSIDTTLSSRPGHHTSQGHDIMAQWAGFTELNHRSQHMPSFANIVPTLPPLNLSRRATHASSAGRMVFDSKLQTVSTKRTRHLSPETKFHAVRCCHVLEEDKSPKLKASGIYNHQAETSINSLNGIVESDDKSKDLAGARNDNSYQPLDPAK